ncbi:MAG: DUF86 domain-containing protein [Oligoflexia bacterium]|nr:DUF86 domain-containing protein [Oligoflexia bacterium]
MNNDSKKIKASVINRDLLNNKLESLRRILERINSKIPKSEELLLSDIDVQDVIILNLQRAVQQAVDIACHILSSLEVQAPSSMSESFLLLERAQIISKEVANVMTKTVGFRNIAIHEYQEIDWMIVYKIITKHLSDFKSYMREIDLWMNR